MRRHTILLALFLTLLSQASCSFHAELLKAEYVSMKRKDPPPQAPAKTKKIKATWCTSDILVYDADDTHEIGYIDQVVAKAHQKSGADMIYSCRIRLDKSGMFASPCATLTGLVEAK